jgi:hypothetical protein
LFPSLKHLFGTDNLGRDIFSRVIYGSKISLSVGLIAVGIAVIIGGTLGAISGFYSKTDNIIMRFMDIFMAIPSLLMALAITTALGSGTRNLMIAVGISSMPQYARIMRASVLTVKDQEYVEAARSIGAACTGNAGCRQCHHVGGDAELFRARRTASYAGMGLASFHRQKLHSSILADDDFPGHCDYGGRLCFKHFGRWTARRA